MPDRSRPDHVLQNEDELHGYLEVVGAELLEQRFLTRLRLFATR